MKHLLAALLIVIAGTASARRRLETESLMAVPWADTEATTNLVLCLGASDAWNAVFTLDFEATSSNNVEFAFGKDVDGNGSLAPEEQELTVGWDCGKWFATGRSGLRGAFWSEGVVGFSAEPVTETPRKTFSWKSLLSPTASARSVAVSENGVPLSFGFPAPLPVWLYRPDWDTVRVTVRGVDNAAERLTVDATRVGTLVIIR